MAVFQPVAMAAQPMGFNAFANENQVAGFAFNDFANLSQVPVQADLFAGGFGGGGAGMLGAPP
jgi:hypothetical protein